MKGLAAHDPHCITVFKSCGMQFFFQLIFYHAHPFSKVKKEKEYLVTIIKEKE